MPNLTIVIIVATVITAGCWVASLISHDYSWVDRSWSLSPIVYAWIFVGGMLSSGTVGPATARAILMAVLISLWGLRLTFNFARKGGYSGMEDYRWAIVRRSMRPWAWQLFNIFFICLYQNALLVLITLPVAWAAAHPSDLTPWDLLCALLFLAALLTETVADQQQWDFQQAKKAAGGRLDPGFVRTGLFRFSRHPNFFGEIAQWWLVYALGAVAISQAGDDQAGDPCRSLILTALGPLLLVAVFVGSTIMTESISAGKYPAYAEYQRTTSPLIPWPSRHTTSCQA